MKSLYTVKLAEIKEVWESFTGWYWYVTELHEGTLAFGLVRGWDTEWGYFDLAELRQLAKQSKVWKVPKQNWAFCPCVDDDAVLCSRAIARGETIERRWRDHGTEQDIEHGRVQNRPTQT